MRNLLRAWRENGTWCAAHEECFNVSLRFADTKAEAIRLASEAHEDYAAPRKRCRSPNHVGEPWLPANLRHFPQHGRRTRRDGSPLLRPRCVACTKADQAEYYRRRRDSRFEKEEAR